MSGEPTQSRTDSASCEITGHSPPPSSELLIYHGYGDAMHRARLTPMDDCDGPWICFPDTHDVGTPGDVLYTVDDFQFSIRNGVHPQLACALGDDDDHNNKVERFAMNERTAWLGLACIRESVWEALHL